METKVTIEGGLVGKNKYVSENEALFANLFARAGFDGAHKMYFVRRVPGHGGFHQGIEGVKISRPQNVQNRKVSIYTQVAGNDSRFEFMVTTPQNMVIEEFIERLEKARGDLARDSRSPRVAEVVKKILDDFGNSSDCLTALTLLPEALAEMEDGEFRVKRSVFELLDEDQQELLIRVCRETTVLVLNIGKGVDGGGVYSFDQQLYRRVINDLVESGHVHVSKDSESVNVDSEAGDMVKKTHSDLETVEELLRDAEVRKEEAEKRHEEVTKRIAERTEQIQHEDWKAQHKVSVYEGEKDVAHDLNRQASEIQAEISQLEVRLKEVVSERALQQERVQKANAEAIHQQGVYDELVRDQMNDGSQLERVLKNIEACKADIEFAQSEVEQLKQKPVRDLIAMAKTKNLTREQMAELMQHLEAELKKMP